jgi:hypothetical protein
MWDHTPASSQKSGFFSQLGFSTTFTGALNQNKEPVCTPPFMIESLISVKKKILRGRLFSDDPAVISR